MIESRNCVTRRGGPLSISTDFAPHTRTEGLNNEKKDEVKIKQVNEHTRTRKEWSNEDSE
jgi:hypothetical protein